MSRYSLDEFVNTTRQKDQGQGIFEMESARLLEVNLNGRIWTKMGSMVAYRGQVKFTREGILEHGVGKFLKKAVSGEGARLTKAEGTGKVYLADQGKKVTILNLQGETIVVNGNDLLAFEEQIQWDISIMKKMTAMMAVQAAPTALHTTAHQQTRDSSVGAQRSHRIHLRTQHSVQGR